jgi:hypothetical protein
VRRVAELGSLGRFTRHAVSTTIYISLLDEGSPCWRPVAAEPVGTDVYRVVGTRTDDTETWEFVTGDSVRCREQTFSDGQRGLVAYERVTVNAA